MKRFFLILKLFSRSKFIFKNPEKRDLVIFDDESLSDLQYLIHHYNFFLLQVKINNINKIYFSLKIFKYFLKHYNGNIFNAYLISLLEIINPKVVLTNIDNSSRFFDVAKTLDKKINFMAIQNASRWDFDEYKHRYKKNMIKSDLSKNFYIPNFFCFGQFKIDHYKKYEIKVKNFFKVGSLRLANFFHYISKNKIQIKKPNYDICLISCPAITYNDVYGEKDIATGYVGTIKFTIQFCMKHNMKLIFAMKRDKKLNPEGYKKEFNFYKKYFTKDELNYLISNSLVKEGDSSFGYSSYMAMIQSEVTVCTWSTMLRENLAIGGKILSCNLLPTNIWDFPIQGICSIKNCNFQEFEKRLLQIYSMTKNDYFTRLNKDKCYAVEFDEKVSTIEILKDKIDYFLTNRVNQSS